MHRLGLLSAVGVMLLAGCASTGDNNIHVKIEAKPGAEASKSRYPLTLRVARYVDERGLDNPRKLGVTEARVTGLTGKELLLDKAASELVFDVMSNRFSASGVQVLAQDDAGALYELSGVVKELRLDVKAQDQVQLLVQTTLLEIASGKVVWSGEVEQKHSRYAGVSGNSRADIANYLQKHLIVVADKTVEAINSVLMATRPELFNLVPGAKVIPGVMTLQTAGPSAAKIQSPAGESGLKVATVPSGAKMYLDGVYYGVSPIRIEAPAGVHTVVAKLKGYKQSTEKVAVRQGENTELEMVLGK